MHPALPALRPLVAALLLALSLGTLAAEPATEAVYAYTVSPRDTLIGLGRDLLVRPGAWPEVAKLNKLPDANRIQPGQVLQVPYRLLRSAQVPARVLSVQGDVRLDDQPVQAGATLAPGQSLSTAAESSAVLQLGDGSRIRLSPLSGTRLDEHRRFELRPNADQSDSGLFASTLRLVRGTVEVLASKVTRAKPLEVTTPTAVIGVRGTEYRVRHADAQSATEVLEGKVRADTGGAAGADVAGGFGAALQAGRAPEVVALSPAPDLAGLPALFERPVLRFALPASLGPLRVQVAADTAFNQLVRDERVEAGAETRIAGLTDGTWQLRVRRIDARGIEGFDSTRAITLKARPEPPAAMAPRAQGKQAVGTVRFAWAENTEAARYRLQVARDAGFRQIVWQAEDLSGASVEAPLAEDGSYFWRLASVRASGDRGPWGDAQTFELRPMPAAPQGGLSEDGQRLQLGWTARQQDRQQVQLARDPQFSTLLAQDELTEARWSVARPEQPGEVYFRYRAVEPDGFVTPWSSTLKIEIPRGRDWMYLVVPLLFAL